MARQPRGVHQTKFTHSQDCADLEQYTELSEKRFFPFVQNIRLNPHVSASVLSKPSTDMYPDPRFQLVAFSVEYIKPPSDDSLFGVKGSPTPNVDAHYSLLYSPGCQLERFLSLNYDEASVPSVSLDFQHSLCKHYLTMHITYYDEQQESIVSLGSMFVGKHLN